jgi:hypothetical protein
LENSANPWRLLLIVVNRARLLRVLLLMSEQASKSAA